MFSCYDFDEVWVVICSFFGWTCSCLQWIHNFLWRICNCLFSLRNKIISFASYGRKFPNQYNDCPKHIRDCLFASKRCTFSTKMGIRPNKLHISAVTYQIQTQTKTKTTEHLLHENGPQGDFRSLHTVLPHSLTHSVRLTQTPGFWFGISQLPHLLNAESEEMKGFGTFMPVAIS